MAEKYFFQRYLSIEKLKSSLYGDVFRGKDVETSQGVIITVFRSDVVTPGDFLPRFEPILGNLESLGSRGYHKM